MHKTGRQLSDHGKTRTKIKSVYKFAASRIIDPTGTYMNSMVLLYLMRYQVAEVRGILWN
jgi:hypothetical protein